jgi:hypothetical protein
LERNESERAEAERNETEYDRAMKSAIMRAQDEVDEEFKGKRLEIDEAEQARREKEAGDANIAAREEELREEAELAAKKAKEADDDQIKSDLLSSPHPYADDGYAKGKWSLGFRESVGRDAMPFDTDTRPENREYLTPAYVAKALAEAPASIKDAVKEALEATTLKGNERAMNNGGAGAFFYAAENLGYAFEAAYLKGAFGRKAGKAQMEVGGVFSDGKVKTPDGEQITSKQHAAGMKAMQKLDTYLGKVFAGAKGNTERHPKYEPEEE